MERMHLPVIRYRLHLILFSAWCVAVIADIQNERSFGSWNISATPPSIRGIKCTIRNEDMVIKWSCGGDKLLQVPSNLTTVSTKDGMILKLEHAGIRNLSANSLAPYVENLWELHLAHVPEFDTLEPGIFENMTKLHTIYIAHAQKLTHIHDHVFDVHLPRLQSIRVIWTGLHKLPSLRNLVVGNMMLMVDFANNHIDRIDTASIKIDSRDLLLNYNKISSVSRMAFNGSNFGRLSLMGNRALTIIHEDAFVGIKNIISLDLSGTSITTLPTNGLQNIKKLNIENTKTLKRFPAVVDFETITTAKLTYPYHCCAFKFPAKQDPEMYQKYEESVRKMKEKCESEISKFRHRRNDDALSRFDDIDRELEETDPKHSPTIIHYCDTISRPKNVTCYPEPDAFNPCEDIMGYWGLRIAVWLVAVLAIFGNLAVLIVLVFSGVEMTVPKFLMCNLAWADLCMGIYLTLIASMDAATIGKYFNHAIDWQSGLGCKIAGFLTVFSTELSIFTLTVITCERWYTITYAVHLNKRLKLKTSIKIMAVGWVYSFVMAGFPIAHISGYEKTSICLPLTNRNETDLFYLITLLVFNGLAFLAIVLCYGRMYSSIRLSRETATPIARTDMTVAKRMALLVFVDFVCWAPIAFFAIAALGGRSLINVTQTKIVLVFIYPLNSCANPYLYALLTRQYRHDLFTFLARHGMCQKRAAKYRGAIAGCLTPIRNQVNLINRSKTDNLQPPSTQNTTLTNSDIPTHNNGLTASSDNDYPGKTAIDNHNADVQEANSCPAQKNLLEGGQPDVPKLNISEGAVE